MQISQSQNQASFGVNLKYSDDLAKNMFLSKLQVSPNKMSKLMDNIKNIKPVGPDIDVFIKNLGNYAETATGKKQYLCEYESKIITPKNLVKGIKNLVKQVSDSRMY